MRIAARLEGRSRIDGREDGKGVILPIREAIRRYVRPGMELHLAGGRGGPGAAVCEIVRQFRRMSPEFVLIQSTVTGHSLHLIHCGLIRKMVFATCTETSDSVRPSRVFQKAYKEKRIEVENWSLCSLQQRLMAGAMGLPFMPTRSISGSTLASDLREAFIEIGDPFGTERIGVVRALRPDISIVHGCVADDEGNTILGAPIGDDLWGTFASKGGALVTVEKIVSSDVIRKYSSLVRIPGHVVKAVSLAPLGVHPFAFLDPGIAGLDPYDIDREFLRGMSAASDDCGALDAWIREWVIDCASHEAYLEKLGNQRVAGLMRAAAAVPLWGNPPASPDRAEMDYSPEEMMFVAAAREVISAVKRSQHRLLLVGSGSRVVAPWLAYYRLRSEGYGIDVMTGNGQIGYTPLPGEAFIQSAAAIRTSKMLADTVTAHGVLVGGGSRCLSILGAAQIDRFGNINSTKLSADRFLVGSGGGNDSVNAREVIVIVNQSRTRFPESVPHITSPGDNVTAVVSSMGIFRKNLGKEKLRLAACFPGSGMSRDELIGRIREECGWPLETAETVEQMPEPTREELGVLRWLRASPPEGTGGG